MVGREYVITNKLMEANSIALSELLEADTSTHVQAWCKEDNYPLCIISGGNRFDVSSDNISQAFKHTHSLRRGVANALALAGYSNTQIRKIGQCWRGATCKE
jgi:hypothetical protein